MTRCSQRERVVTQIIHSEKQLTHSFASKEHFHSRSQQPRKFVVTKESCYLRRRLNSLRTGLENHHGRRFAVLRHQYGGRDNMRKHSMNKILIIHNLNSGKLLLFVTTKWLELLLFSVKNVHSIFCGSFTFFFLQRWHRLFHENIAQWFVEEVTIVLPYLKHRLVTGSLSNTQ